MLKSRKPLTFVLISCRLFENDWRVSLFESLREREFDYYHLRLGRFSVLTNPQTRTNRTFQLTEFPKMLRELRGSMVNGTIPIYFVSTATAVPSLVMALRVFLRRGVWLFNVYDDYSLYWGPRLRRVKGHIINWLFYRVMSATIIAPPNLRKKFPNAFELEIASDIQRIDHNPYDLKRIVITSNLDARLDYDFVREVAIRRPDHEIHIYGRISDYVRGWPRLRDLLNAANNIKYHGEFPEKDLPKLLSQYCVALAPFKAHAPFTQSTDPARFYDYLNAGIEIICTDIPRARDRSEFLHIAVSAVDAVGIWRELESNSRMRKTPRWDFLQHSWRHRSEQLLQILDHLGCTSEPPDRSSSREAPRPPDLQQQRNAIYPGISRKASRLNSWVDLCRPITHLRSDQIPKSVSAAKVDNVQKLSHK